MDAPRRPIDVNNPAAYDEKMVDPKLDPGGDGSPTEVMSQGSDHIPRNQLCLVQDQEENVGSPSTPMLKLDGKTRADDREKLQEPPFRRARVSVRARSEASMVISIIYCVYICFHNVVLQLSLHCWESNFR